MLHRLFTLIVLAAGAFANGQVVVYPAIEGLATSDELTVKVNGRNVWVEKLSSNFRPDQVPEWFLRTDYTRPPQQVNIVNFSCRRPIDVEIRAAGAITDYTIGPKSRQIKAQLHGNTLRFKLPGPDKLYIEIDSYAPLCFFANPLETHVPKPGDKGVLYYAPGVHRPGVITLKDGQTLYLAGGAIVYGAIDGSPRGARVIGRGILDGEYKHRLVELKGARDVRFEGVILRNGRIWQNTLRDCDRVDYDHVKVISFGNSGDGINPVGSRNVTISNCFLRCTDDCIAIKSMGPGQIVENIRVLDSTMIGYAYSDGVTIGFETNGPYIRDVLVKNCDILIARGGSRVDGHSAFSIICDGPARIHDIRYEDIRVESRVLKLFELHITDGTSYQADPPGHINGVYLKNISFEADRPIVLKGFDATHLVENVIFENCTVAGKLLRSTDDASFQINKYVRNLKFK